MIYDPLVWVLSAGRVDALRRATLAAAGLGRGGDVLDAGCGTGALTVAARELAGPHARVVGLDASASMRARTRRRATGTGTKVELVAGRAEWLPFPDASFDVVVLSLVLHHLPPDRAAQAIAEACRVLRDGGRVVVVDFGRSRDAVGRLRAHLMLHGGSAASALDLGALLAAGGLSDVVPQPSPVPALNIVRATRRDHLNRTQGSAR
jgi:ubiquinone/menaquinone biosynthesis C-methylase UbiE